MEYKSTSLVPKKADILILIAALVMAVGIITYFARTEAEGSTAIILRDGKEIMRIDLSAVGEKEYTVEGDYINHILVKDGSISVIESTCPGGVCVSSGSISEAGKSIVCLPNRMEIRITGSEEVDVVVG
ncbi:MAG: NusG domain II-containing protein [Ruminococcaceae bacterium]|nr:NusG domain II-containing protein [Oscillospiraceae bacterium]